MPVGHRVPTEGWQIKGIPNYGQVPISGTVAKIHEATPGRVALIIKNIGSTAIYIGTGPDVTIGNGFLLEANASFRDDVTESAWWGISAGSSTASFIEAA